MAPHSSTLAWKIPWMEEPGRLQSMGSLRVGHNWATSVSCIGEGNGNPLQCSCLENPRDGGAWWAAVYGVAQSRTWLKQLSSSSSNTLQANFCALYQELGECVHIPVCDAYGCVCMQTGSWRIGGVLQLLPSPSVKLLHSRITGDRICQSWPATRFTWNHSLITGSWRGWKLPQAYQGLCSSFFFFSNTENCVGNRSSHFLCFLPRFILPSHSGQ